MLYVLSYVLFSACLFIVFFYMLRRPPRSTRTDTSFPTRRSSDLNEKFGESITAVVVLAPGSAFDESEIIAHLKGKLAAYKAPKRVLSIDTIGRAPNGKVDYKRLKSWAADEVTSATS